MADLTDLQSAGTVKIVGSDSAGVETNAVNADSSGNLLVKTTSAGTVAAGTVATQSSLGGGQFNNTLPTLTNTQQSAIQLDSSGRQLVSPNTQFSTASNTRVAVDNSASVQLLAANANRKYAYIMNNTGKAFYLKLGAAAVGSQGILLSNNGMYEITANNLWTGTVNAISSSSTSTSLDVFEGTP